MTAHPDHWNRIYEAEPRPGWDMAQATPVLAELLDLAAPLGLPTRGSAVVPGCGYGHDAAALAALGYQATGVDFAPRALAGARERYGEAVRWVQEDWFTPALGPWDLIFDHTCLVAMDPNRREAYAEACARHLAPGGWWLAVAFHDVEGRPGPPHAISEEALRTLAAPHFEVLHLGSAHRSHPRRAGRETLMVARKR